MTPKNLLSSFEAWRRQSRPLVMATVYETAGSTYSKAGARMLIDAGGDFQGMLSGGCLEGDLAERARQVLESRRPQTVSYDLGGNDEELWGLGVGCDGLMRIFLQPLIPAKDYAPFVAIARALEGDSPSVAATVIESSDETIPPGATLVEAEGRVDRFLLNDRSAAGLHREFQQVLASKTSSVRKLRIADAELTVLFALIRPRPRLLVLGGGLDVEPLTRLAAELDWRITIMDHRPAYIENGDFEPAERVICSPVEDMSKRVDLSKFDAAIVMSHHLASDRAYLRQLAATEIPYIGLLGPKNRRERLLEDLGAEAASLEGRLHGPAGFDIGASGPAAIALSILAEVHLSIART